MTGDLKTDAERYRVPRGPGGNPIRIGDKVRSMKSTQPLGQLKVKYGADKVRDYYKKNKAVGESFEIDKSAHKTAQKKAKMRNLAKGNTNPNEKAAAEKKAGGPKLMGEKLSFTGWKKRASDVMKKTTVERQPEKAQDAGAKAKRKLARKVHAKYVSGSEDLVPDDIRDHYEV